MSTIDEKTIIEALSGLKHPQTGQDIISGDIVQGITICDGNVGFLLAVPPVFADAFEAADFSTLTLFHFMDSIRMKLKIYFTVYVQTIFNNVENLRFENLI